MGCFPFDTTPERRYTTPVNSRVLQTPNSRVLQTLNSREELYDSRVLRLPRGSMTSLSSINSQLQGRILAPLSWELPLRVGSWEPTLSGERWESGASRRSCRTARVSIAPLGESYSSGVWSRTAWESGVVRLGSRESYSSWESYSFRESIWLGSHTARRAPPTSSSHRRVPSLSLQPPNGPLHCHTLTR